ncbi:MAG: hypothetical protein QM586_16515, partial [Xenophilus sp.]
APLLLTGRTVRGLPVLQVASQGETATGNGADITYHAYDGRRYAPAAACTSYAEDEAAADAPLAVCEPAAAQPAGRR